MIVKDSAPTQSDDKLRRAGFDAERQMAFYLKRTFGDDPSVHVLHDLRLEHEGDAAQIDHLLLHRFGMVIVESKSVTTTVRVNARGEWSRLFSGRWSGMASPVLQARRQGDFLKAFLARCAGELLGTSLLGARRSFGPLPLDVLVAISDRSLVEHAGTLAEMRKADQVPDRARELLQAQRQRAGMFGWNLSNEEFARVSAFLRARHMDPPKQEARPSPGVNQPASAAREHSAVPSPAAPPKVPSTTFPKLACRKCAGGNVEVTFGHSYYAKCRDCGNTPIHLSCLKCGGKLRTRKSGRDFYAECAGCHTSARYHTNPT